ncbi:hypothetical protein B0H34DRAFT_794781 [Crassisporium funariophilum]|nr:hypothetical protein B0H34DRAFT_794781 [Crassisporium funariophilum]
MNNTNNFMQSKLGAADLVFVWKQACKQDASGEDQCQRQAQALHDQNVVATKRARDAEVCRKKEEFEREIDAVEPLLNVRILKSKLHNRTFTSSLIIQQVDWHRQYSKAVILQLLVTKMKQEDKLTHLIVLVEAYNNMPKPVVQFDAAEGSIKQPEDIPVQPD